MVPLIYDSFPIALLDKYLTACTAWNTVPYIILKAYYIRMQWMVVRWQNELE